VREEDATPRWTDASPTRAHPMRPWLEWKRLEGAMTLRQRWLEEEGASCCALTEWTAAATPWLAHQVAVAAPMDCSCVVLVELNEETPRLTRLHPRSTLRSEVPVVHWWGWLVRVAALQ